MSNIILTTDCPRKCSYCFAKDNKNDHMYFNMENFKIAVNWLTENNPYISRVGLLGGEPTYHPRFLDFIDYLLSKKISTVVFTNGMVEEINFYNKLIEIAYNNKVKDLSNFSFCLNMNEEKYRSKIEEKLQSNFIKNLGRVTTLSFNIFEENFNPYFLINTIKENNMVPSIRLGLAAPLGYDNDYLKIESFNFVGHKIVEFCKKATENKINIGFDCGFVPCMFFDEDFDILKSLAVENWAHNCEPPIDIYPNLEVSCCFPTSRVLRTKISDWPDTINLYDHWIKELNKIKPIYEGCQNCKYYLATTCGGGCKAHNING